MNLKGFDTQPVRVTNVFGIQLDRPVSSMEMRIAVSNALTLIARRLKENGCALIGHIKAYLDTCGNDGIFFSVTKFGQEPQCRGEIKGDIRNAELILNVIVFGISEKLVKEAVEDSLKDLIF